MFILKVSDDIALRMVEERDAEDIFALANSSRAYLREWLPWVDGTEAVEHTKAFIQSCRKANAENRSLTTVILYRDKIVGIAGFNVIHSLTKTTEIGYWLGEDFQGKGIMTTVVRAMITYAFDYLGLNKVVIRAAVENKKSRGIPERLGFTHEGTLRDAEWLNNHYVDLCIYGMLKREWETIK